MNKNDREMGLAQIRQIAEQAKQPGFVSKENRSINEDIQELKVAVQGDKSFEQDDKTVRLPRFGLLSILARRIPMFAYDHPSLVSKHAFGPTACTDGHHIFFNAKFLDALLSEDEDDNTESAVFVLLHELCHILYMHHDRFIEADPDIANIAEDLSINSRLRKNFPQVKVGETPGIGYGMKDGDIERYAELSEEEIYRMLMKEIKNKLEEQEQEQEQDQGGKGQDSEGQDSEGQDSEGQDSEGQGGKGQGGKGQGGKGQGGKGQGGKGQGGSTAVEDDIRDIANNIVGANSDAWDAHGTHIITLEELIEILEEAGLTDSLEKLELPDKCDADGLEEKRNEQFTKIVSDIQKAAKQASEHGDRFPGQHMMDSLQEYIKDLTRPKLSWKMVVEDLIHGHGNDYDYSDDYPGDLYFVDPSDMGMEGEVYEGQTIPSSPDSSLLVLVDTSGSVDTKMLTQFFSEIFGLVDEAHGSAKEAIVLSADTVLRGEPMVLTRENYMAMVDKMVASGRGGTDFKDPIWQAMELDIVREKKLSGLVYFTDLGAHPPSRAELPSNLPPMAYITTPECMTPTFVSAVEDYAMVADIEEDKEIDLDEIRRRSREATAGMGM